MASFPIPVHPAEGMERGAASQRQGVPDYLPARMVNEFVYCPRLFFYEWTQGLFRESADTVEGKVQHRRADAGPSKTPKPEEEAALEKIHSRSLTLASERLRVIAKLDLLEGDGGIFTPVDYKHGKPRETDAGLELWPSDRVQLAIQGMLLRENGYRCEEGIVFYQATKQRVRVPFDAVTVREAEDAIEAAWIAGTGTMIPAPLEDSPKCPGCSMVGICLPDETRRASEPGVREPGMQMELFGSEFPGWKPVRRETIEIRRMVAPREVQRPVYLNSQGMRVGKSGEVLQMKIKEKLEQEARIGEICQVNLMGNVQVSTQRSKRYVRQGCRSLIFHRAGGITEPRRE